MLFPLESTLVIVRTKNGLMVPSVDGKPLAGCGHLICEAGSDGCYVQLTFPAGAVHFETESSLDPKEMN